jgi:hypothetical protein
VTVVHRVTRPARTARRVRVVLLVTAVLRVVRRVNTGPRIAPQVAGELRVVRRPRAMEAVFPPVPTVVIDAAEARVVHSAPPINAVVRTCHELRMVPPAVGKTAPAAVTVQRRDAAASPAPDMTTTLRHAVAKPGRALWTAAPRAVLRQSARAGMPIAREDERRLTGMTKAAASPCERQDNSVRPEIAPPAATALVTLRAARESGGRRLATIDRIAVPVLWSARLRVAGTDRRSVRMIRRLAGRTATPCRLIVRERATVPTRLPMIGNSPGDRVQAVEPKYRSRPTLIVDSSTRACALNSGR